MAENTVYYYDGDWRPYSELYSNYGLTLVPSKPIILYDLELNEYPGWVDTSNNNIWVVTDTQWYTTEDNLPYWRKLDSKYKVYLIGQPLPLDKYVKQLNEMYDYNGSLQSFQYMHLGFGITLTPSEIYFVKDGVIKCWYNRDINKYWDVDSCHWYDTAPDYSEYESGDINAIGAIGTFIYYNRENQPTHYGSFVDGSELQPVYMSVPSSGEISYTRVKSVMITGTWKIMTEVTKSSKDKPCIVLATKVSTEFYTPIVQESPENELNNVANEQSSQSNNNQTTLLDGSEGQVSYDL